MYIQPNTRRKMREHVLRRETYMYAKETCLYVGIAEHTHRNAGASTQTRDVYVKKTCIYPIETYMYAKETCIYVRTTEHSLYVSFAEYRLFNGVLLQKTPII